MENTLQQNIIASLPPLVRMSKAEIIAWIDESEQYSRYGQTYFELLREEQKLVADLRKLLSDCKHELQQPGISTQREVAAMMAAFDRWEDRIADEYRPVVQAIYLTLYQRLVDYAE